MSNMDHVLAVFPVENYPSYFIQMDSFNYVRAYDRLKKRFRTFKLNRIINSTTATRTIGPVESIENDLEWHKNKK